MDEGPRRDSSYLQDGVARVIVVGRNTTQHSVEEIESQESIDDRWVLSVLCSLQQQTKWWTLDGMGFVKLLAGYRKKKS